MVFGRKTVNNRSYLIEVGLYKMMHHFTDVPGSLLEITTDRSTRGHNLQLVKSHCHTDSRLYFFSSRVVNG